MNLYGFVYNNPLFWYDYLGREPASWEEPGRQDISRDEFEKQLKKKGKKISKKLSFLLDQGCIGLCASRQGVIGNPEHYDETDCFLTEPETDKVKCPKGTKKVVFAKQGRFKDGKEPDKDKDGSVSNNSVTANGGLFNYVTTFRVQGKRKYAWMDHAIEFGPQTVTFHDIPADDDHYPDEIWCVSCVPCKNGDGSE